MEPFCGLSYSVTMAVDAEVVFRKGRWRRRGEGVRLKDKFAPWPVLGSYIGISCLVRGAVGRELSGRRVAIHWPMEFGLTRAEQSLL